ncbi:MAG: cupin domain-containing protein [Thaumarchaeota archaeon]|nr:cupin domain-containing protein [Nitrososphaerota archaeon]
MAEKADERAAPRRRGGLEAGVKQPLAGLVAYGEGSVVSRTIIDRRAGTVTIFAFDEGEGLSPHTSPYDALLYVTEGRALVTIGGVESQLDAGEAIILPAGQPHAVRAVGKFKMTLTMIRE